jgi:hypothetical protein
MDSAQKAMIIGPENYDTIAEANVRIGRRA